MGFCAHGWALFVTNYTRCSHFSVGHTGDVLLIASDGISDYWQHKSINLLELVRDTADDRQRLYTELKHQIRAAFGPHALFGCEVWDDLTLVCIEL